MKILLVRNDNIGDLVCTTPAIEALRKKYKDARIDIVVNSLNSFVVENNPFLDKIYLYAKTKHKKKLKDKIIALIEKTKILYKIKKEKYDICLIFRSSYSKNAGLFAKFSNAKEIIGIDEKNESKFITKKIPKIEINEIKLCYEILKPLDIKYQGEKTLFLPKSKINTYNNFIFFHISSRIKENKLSKEKICQILSILKAKTNNIIITAEDSDFATQISQISDVKCLQTKNLQELASYIYKAKFFITLDGGIAHLAPAMGINTLILFGKTNINRWKPISCNAKCVVLQDETKLANNINLEDIHEKIDDFL
ncbi:glycosyltransferase family 9 protein [Campylobacter sputorum]|uniref:glycosyltransferase family 9 protein n=1 Tax=Campylobacter sputorum TaxID=206 RepID=UPI00053BDA41|nr:glycosyltransferase family 9 protein [Campylobacter sputorum]